MKHLLQVKKLSVSYITPKGRLTIVNKASFDITKGDVVGLVGKSGEGKTTLALALLDLLPENASKDTGNIVFEGEDITHMSPQMSLRIRGKEMGLCLQDPLASLNPVLTIGYQLIEFIRSHNNISSTEARERALKLLNHVHINNPERVLHLYPHELSGGMRQRVLLVMAIACNPKLLILDEPTSSLDVLTERSVINFILELKKEFNLTLLLISHNSDLITRTCNRVLVLSEGRVVEKM